MPILVVCPGCKSRFQVSEKFAGKTGACPKCKGQITIPGAAEEVKIHGPSEFSGGGRNAAGQLVLKPIARTETRFRPVTAAIIGAGTIAVLIVTWASGSAIGENTLVRVLGLLLITPPLTIGAYKVLYDDELEPYQGKTLYLRAAACSLAYVALWGVFAYVIGRGLTGEIWNWLFVAPPFLILGALAALACFDLDFGNGCFHYGFYVLVIIVLRWLAGMPWVWQTPPVPPMM